MQLALTADDFQRLDSAQKEAVLAALTTALIADGKPEPQELAVFETALQRLPWGWTPDEIKQKTRAVHQRIASADRDGKLAFLAEVAAALPDPALREKVILSMLAVVSADDSVTRGEKASVSAFIRVFGFTEGQIENLRRQMAEK